MILMGTGIRISELNPLDWFGSKSYNFLRSSSSKVRLQRVDDIDDIIVI